MQIAGWREHFRGWETLWELKVTQLQVRNIEAKHAVTVVNYALSKFCKILCTGAWPIDYCGMFAIVCAWEDKDPNLIQMKSWKRMFL